MGEIALPMYIHEHLKRIGKENGLVDYCVEVDQGSQLSGGFMSELFSITIIERDDNSNSNNTSKKLQLVCKMAPLCKKRQEELMSNVVFAREAAFYTELMPIFTNFQKEKNLICDQFAAYPKCYGATVDRENDHYAIIMEDLRSQEFKMWRKNKIAFIENVRLAMREIGKFHGLSIAIKDQKPHEFAKFTKFTDKFFRSETVRDVYLNSYDHAIASLKEENHKNIMREIKEHFWELLDDCLNEKSASYFGVICHGMFYAFSFIFCQF